MFNLIDQHTAHILQTDVDNYIRKIESTTEKRAEIIIAAVLIEDEKMIAKARRIFNLINHE